MILNNIEQNKLYVLLRQQCKLTQDCCWVAIDVFEKFLQDKRGLKLEAMSNFDLQNDYVKELEKKGE